MTVGDVVHCVHGVYIDVMLVVGVAVVIVVDVAVDSVWCCRWWCCREWLLVCG